MFYDNTAPSSFDLGCEHSNYYGLYRGYEATDGDLDYYFILGPKLADVTRRFADLTGKMAFGPRWSLGKPKFQSYSSQEQAFGDDKAGAFDEYPSDSVTRMEVGKRSFR